MRSLGGGEKFVQKRVVLKATDGRLTQRGASYRFASLFLRSRRTRDALAAATG